MPVLVDAQCMERQPPATPTPHVAPQLEQFRAKLGELAPEAEQAAMTIAEEMRRAGRAEGHTQVLRKLLALKFGALRPEHEARLSSATAEELDRWVERVLTARSIEEVLAD